MGWFRPKTPPTGHMKAVSVIHLQPPHWPRCGSMIPHQFPTTGPACDNTPVVHVVGSSTMGAFGFSVAAHRKQIARCRRFLVTVGALGIVGIKFVGTAQVSKPYDNAAFVVNAQNTGALPFYFGHVLHAGLPLVVEKGETPAVRYVYPAKDAR